MENAAGLLDAFDGDALEHAGDLLGEAGAAGNLEGERQVHAFAQILHGAGGADQAAFHDGEAIHAFLDFGEDVGGEDHRHAFIAEFAQDAVEVADGAGVEAGGGLVEKQQARRAEQGLGKAKALAHAFGVFAHAPAGGVAEADFFEQRGAVLARHGFEVGKEIQGFDAGEVVVENHVFRQVADLAPGFAKARAIHLFAVQKDFAGGDGDEAEHHLEQGALAGAVVADEAEQLARGDGEVDTFYRLHGAEILGRPAGFNDIACQAIFSSRNVRGACVGCYPRCWGRAAAETAGRSGARSGWPGWPSAA